MAKSFQREARDLAEATLRLTQAVRDLYHKRIMPTDVSYPLDDAEGEAKNILAKTVGA